MPTLTDRIAEAFEVGLDEDMPHEPIILDDQSWPKSHALVQYNLNRNAENIHQLRNTISGDLLTIQADTAEKFGELAKQREADNARLSTQREADIERAGDRFDALRDRLTSLETRAALYGAVVGFLAGIGGELLIAYLTKGK